MIVASIVLVLVLVAGSEIVDVPHRPDGTATHDTAGRCGSLHHRDIDTIMIPILVPPLPASTATVASRLLDEVVGRPSSIHGTLGPRLHRARDGDDDALAPGPVVDRSLGRLVGLATACHAGGDHPSPAHRNRIHLEVVAEVGHQLASNRGLTRRAAEIRDAAARAEARLERWHARAALDQPWPAALPRPAPAPLLEPALALGTATDWLLAPTPALDDDELLRLAILRLVLAGFPYLANYELLVAGELAAIAVLAPPDDHRPVGFCGAGALPLTGVILHVLTGADVELIEIDPVVAELAADLCLRLATAGVLRAGAVTVHCADAATIDPARYATVVTASLLPGPTIRAIMAAVAAVPAERGRPLLAVRSAAGLAGCFCYQPVPPSWGTAAGLSHQGAVVPLTSVSLASDPPPGIGAVAIDSPTLLAVAPSAVLNCTELFA